MNREQAVGLAKEVLGYKAQIARLQDERDQARKDVLRYGSHLDDCPHHCPHRIQVQGQCCCGFYEAIERAMGYTTHQNEAK